MDAHTKELIETLQNADHISEECKKISDYMRQYGHYGILTAGNGGSAAESAHLAAELNGRYKSDSRGQYPAIDLSADHATVTALANDYGYDEVFARQVKNHKGKMLFVMSTSGKSKNLVNAVNVAKGLDQVVVCMTGFQGPLFNKGTFNIVVPSANSAIIQEVHLHAIHLICEFLEGHNQGEDND